MSNQQIYRYQYKICKNTFQPTSGLRQCACGAVGVDVLDAARGTLRLLGKPEDVIDMCEQLDLAAGKATKD